MVDNIRKRQTFFQQLQDRLVIVLTLNKEKDGFDTPSFSLRQIEEIRGVDEKNAVLRLEDGREFNICLSYAALKQHLYAADKEKIDLTAYTTINEPMVGALMPDGSIFAGISPDEKKRMFMMKDNEKLHMDFKSAVKCAKKMTAHGHDDWRLPTISELKVIHKNKYNKNLRDLFNNSSGWVTNYWSSTRDSLYDFIDCREYINFVLDVQNSDTVDSENFVCLIRTETSAQEKQKTPLWPFR